MHVSIFVLSRWFKGRSQLFRALTLTQDMHGVVSIFCFDFPFDVLLHVASFHDC